VETRLERRWTPFLVVAAILAIVYLTMSQLPESLVAQLARNRALGSSQTDWAYRLLAFAAIAQATYGGFVLLHPERIQKLRSADSRVATMPRERVLVLVTRTAAVMVLMTAVYGLVSFGLSGQRGGFWLFAVLSVLQGAWYVHQVNVVADYLGFQPEPAPHRALPTWEQPPPDYVPPIARGLEVQTSADPAP
jgi:hypothetical protein